jgi:hypothetical protein
MLSNNSSVPGGYIPTFLGLKNSCPGTTNRKKSNQAGEVRESQSEGTEIQENDMKTEIG